MLFAFFLSLFPNNQVFCTINTMIAFEQQWCCVCLSAIGFSDECLPSYRTTFAKCIQCERELKGIHEKFVCLCLCECINRNTFGFVNQYLSIEWNSDSLFFHENICSTNKLLPKLKVCDSNSVRSISWCLVFRVKCIHSWFSVSKLVNKKCCNFYVHSLCICNTSRLVCYRF